MHLHHDKAAFKELIIGAANELHIPANVIEKDYFVTLTLKELIEVRPTIWGKPLLFFILYPCYFNDIIQLTTPSPYVNAHLRM